MTVTCDNGAAFGWSAEGCCADVTGGDGEASGCVEGACCVGVAGGDGDTGCATGACSIGGEAWARTSFAPAAASAM